MPRFDQQSGELQKRNTGHFGFSAVKLDALGATEYTLVTIVADRSGSTAGFQTEMEAVLKEVVRACQHSPRADNLLVRFVSFASDKIEEHGFKLLSECNLNDYDGRLNAGGMTALYDAAIDGIEATSNLGRELLQQDYSVNGIVFVITDGMENESKFNSTKHVRVALEQAVKGENLESLVSILVAVNITDPMASTELNKFNTEAGFTQFVELKDASKSTLAKLAQFVSKSISSQSQALGTGAPSKSINF